MIAEAVYLINFSFFSIRAIICSGGIFFYSFYFWFIVINIEILTIAFEQKVHCWIYIVFWEIDIAWLKFNLVPFFFFPNINSVFSGFSWNEMKCFCTKESFFWEISFRSLKGYYFCCCYPFVFFYRRKYKV